MSKTVLFQTIQFSIQKTVLFQTTQFNISTHFSSIWPIDRTVWCYHFGTYWIAMKRYFAFPKAPSLLEPHHQIVYCHISGHSFGKFYPSEEKQLMYSIAPTDWAKYFCNVCFLGSLLYSSSAMSLSVGFY